MTPEEFAGIAIAGNNVYGNIWAVAIAYATDEGHGELLQVFKEAGIVTLSDATDNTKRVRILIVATYIGYEALATVVLQFLSPACYAGIHTDAMTAVNIALDTQKGVGR